MTATRINLTQRELELVILALGLLFRTTHRREVLKLKSLLENAYDTMHIEPAAVKTNESKREGTA